MDGTPSPVVESDLTPKKRPSRRPITAAEREVIRAYYDSRKQLPRGEFKLDDLADAMCRSKSQICRAARAMGLTDPNRRVSPELSEKSKTFFLAWHEANTHPRGMAGKTHTPEVRKLIAEHSARYWSEITESERSHRADAFRATYRSHGVKPSTSGYSRARRGFREDIQLNVRSSWEANYCRILNARVADPDDPLTRWEYEPDTFWFDAIKRGVRSYLPDFKLFEDGSEPYYVEVKGWMDAKSKTKLKRMQKYHPKVRVVVVDSVEYKKLEYQLSAVIVGWEFPEPKPGSYRRRP